MSEKLTQEELVELQSAIQKYEDASFRTGQYTIEIETLKQERSKLVQMSIDALETRQAIVSRLEQKYGEGVKINPIIFGGGQENGKRSGTENIAGVVGLAKALEIAQKKQVKELSENLGIKWKDTLPRLQEIYI